MDTEFYLFGSLLAVCYEVLTTKKKDYKQLGFLICSTVFICLIIFNWSGLIFAIAADFTSNRNRIEKLENKLKEE